MIKHFFSLTIIATLFATAIQPVSAADSGCKPLYGGGVTKEESCGKPVLTNASPTPVKTTPAPVKSGVASPQAGTKTQPKAGTTKGGLPVVTPKPAKTTPSTGPEMLGLLALAPAAALGMYLRKQG